ncbi:ABC transporter ATP-binding protein [Lachnoclostridium edouardi]|uniref:ABC transporter ATP-binding protein n=1 Tax=Lachnoclostridium edouardi TaxID=1926283 RepID=UPI000C7E63AF|nr:ABC transporter ATP-binding protein [Lachnoclostridium edouardi]
MDKEKVLDVNENLLDIKDLSVTYKTEDGVVYAVNNLNLSIGHKETLGFVGETGAGKTTTAMTIMGLLPIPPGKVTSGEILFDGRDMLKISDRERRGILGEEISMIFQDPMTSLNPSMKVGDQIVEMIRLHKSIGKKEAFEEACGLLEMVGIRRERANDYPHQFSGGMKQRVVIAIALACRPKMIIADEPTTALDVTIQAQVMNLIKELKEKLGTSMILITHDLGIVAEICDKVAIMYAGQVVEYAQVEKIYNNPCHPYTKGLFNSIPKLDTEEEWLEEIHGLPPEPTEKIEGCSFNPRCPNCMEICKHKKPDITCVDGEHYTRCFLYEKQEEGKKDE